jgi:hypothetical protein
VPPVGPPLAALPGGIQAADHQAQALQRRLLGGEVPRVLTARRNRASRLSIALVVAITARILRIEVEEGHKLCPGVVPQLDDRRIAGLPLLAELDEPLECCGLGGGGVDRFEVTGDPGLVLAAGIPEAVAQQAHDARLDDGGRPDLRDRLRQPAQPVADQDAAVAGAAVLISVSTCSQQLGAPGRRRRPTGPRCRARRPWSRPARRRWAGWRPARHGP